MHAIIQKNYVLRNDVANLVISCSSKGHVMHTTCSNSVSVMYIHDSMQVSVWYSGYMVSVSITAVHYQSQLVFRSVVNFSVENHLGMLHATR